MAPPFFARKKSRVRRTFQLARFASGEICRQAFVRDRIRAKAIDCGYARQLLDFVRHFCAHDGISIGRGRSRRTQIEIGPQLVLHPYRDGIAKTADHDPDACRHRDRSGQRRGQNGSSGERGPQGARCKQAFDSEDLCDKVAESLDKCDPDIRDS